MYLIDHLLYMFFIPIPPFNCLFLETFRVLICVFKHFLVVGPSDVFEVFHRKRAILDDSRDFYAIFLQLPRKTAVNFCSSAQSSAKTVHTATNTVVVVAAVSRDKPSCEGHISQL